jgi:hypothetical protein
MRGAFNRVSEVLKAAHDKYDKEFPGIVTRVYGEFKSRRVK